MSAARTERLLNLLGLLLNARRPISLREIRELDEFEAYRNADPKSGERAFERDKAALLEAGVPLTWVPPDRDDVMEGTEGLGGYIIDRAEYYLPDLALTPTDLALLSMAGAAAAAMPHFPGRGDVLRALAKLGFDADAGAPARSMAHAPVLPGIDPERIRTNLETLQLAIGKHHRVHLTYESASGDHSEREVDAYGLYYARGAWYMVGFCHLRHDERTFHLGRINQAKDACHNRVRGPDYDIPKGFDLSAHARRRPWEFPHAAPQTVELAIAEKLVPAIPEIFGPQTTVESTPRGTRVCLRVTHQAALVATILPYGAAVQVLRPKTLRAEIGALYRRLADRYGSGHER